MRPDYRSKRKVLRGRVLWQRNFPVHELGCLVLASTFCCANGAAQNVMPHNVTNDAREAALINASLPDAPGMGSAPGISPAAEGQATGDAQTPGNISGTVVDVSGKVIPSARVSLASATSAQKQEAVTDSDGYFSFLAVPAGAFQIAVTANSFAMQVKSAVLHAGETLQMPPITMPVGTTVTEVRVSMTQQELAEKQIKVEEKQHVLGVIPNFYVSYDHDAVPLTSRQKFELAWKSSIDPFAFIGTGIGAGIEQATNAFSGYGQGAQGYAKRYGAGYADGFIGTMLGGAILPSLFKQDPRYFWKGTGSKKSRVVYAVKRSVLTRGDNGRTEFDYSGILGDLAAGGISNIYYPSSDRNGAGLTFENTAIGIGGSAVANLFQEFVVRHLTPHTHDSASTQE